MQKIKLKIANRVYPLTTQPEREEGLRKKKKKIDIINYIFFIDIIIN